MGTNEPLGPLTMSPLDVGLRGRAGPGHLGETRLLRPECCLTRRLSSTIRQTLLSAPTCLPGSNLSGLPDLAEDRSHAVAGESCAGPWSARRGHGLVGQGIQVEFLLNRGERRLPVRVMYVVIDALAEEAVRTNINHAANMLVRRMVLLPRPRQGPRDACAQFFQAHGHPSVGTSRLVPGPAWSPVPANRTATSSPASFCVKLKTPCDNPINVCEAASCRSTETTCIQFRSPVAAPPVTLAEARSLRRPGPRFQPRIRRSLPALLDLDSVMRINERLMKCGMRVEGRASDDRRRFLNHVVHRQPFKRRRRGGRQPASQQTQRQCTLAIP